MSKIWYLSPSNQGENIGIDGYGSEKEQMTKLVDEIAPHLDRAGVSFHIADPEMTIQQRVQESNNMGRLLTTIPMPARLSAKWLRMPFWHWDSGITAMKT